jgi:vacuolar protein sorting-associated protein 35
MNTSEIGEDVTSTIPSEVQLFEVFSVQIASIVQIRSNMPLEDTVSLQVALVSLAQKVYPDRVDYVDKVLETTCQILERLNMYRYEHTFFIILICLNPNDFVFRISHTLSVNQELLRLQRLCVDFYNNVLTLLHLKFFSPLMEKFDYVSRKSLSLYICMNILENETLIPTAEEAEDVLVLLSPLIKDQDDQPADKIDQEDFAEEQGIVGR